jgi:hypothetical protein
MISEPLHYTRKVLTCLDAATVRKLRREERRFAQPDACVAVLLQSDWPRAEAAATVT